jgi:hypothetical protein
VIFRIFTEDGFLFNLRVWGFESEAVLAEIQAAFRCVVVGENVTLT